MKTLRFQGHSDDTFGEYGETGRDYDNCARQAPIQVEVKSGDEGLVVVGGYHLHPSGACWTIGISMLDEDIPIPEWPMRFSMGDNGYSPWLEIDAPDFVELTWYSAGELVEEY